MSNRDVWCIAIAVWLGVSLHELFKTVFEVLGKLIIGGYQ